MNVEKQQLWSTTIFNYKLEEINNDELKTKILNIEKQGKGFQFNPVQGGGWQSNKSLLEESSLFSLRKNMIESVNKILSTLYIDDANISLINSWANIARDGQCTMPHIHEEASWSAVYYVTPTDDAILYLKDPRTQEAMDASHGLLKQPYSNVIGKRPFNAGEVILFPSWLEHGVAPSTKNTTRISIACNFLIHGNR
jgi:uncharacterized protein (TIGR02466 family)|tara:strand:- start:640 stop:1230 length:591 start_codon:yes stop_codon:yes gene_type:complete